MPFPTRVVLENDCKDTTIFSNRWHFIVNLTARKAKKDAARRKKSKIDDKRSRISRLLVAK